jgi:NIMA (never in mitosis gene a)-related kinase 1/4/5
MNDFEMIEELGRGAFGTVFRVKRKTDGQIYALKRVNIAKMSERDRENALNEIRVLASISHPNVIDYKEAFYDEETYSLNMIMEFADQGDLANKIKNFKNMKTYIPENEIWSCLIQISAGLKALHDKKIMHRDLKSANVFLTKKGEVKLGDLNVSKVVKMGFLKTQTGTPYYASPEVWSEKPYDYKSDIWSLGCIIYEMCALKPPFRAQTLEFLFKAVTKGAYDAIPNTYSKDLVNLLQSLLNVDPKKRPNCELILSMPIIKKKIEQGNVQVVVGEGCLLNTIKWTHKTPEINLKLTNIKRYSKFKLDNNSNSGNKLSVPSINSNPSSGAYKLHEIKETKNRKDSEDSAINKNLNKSNSEFKKDLRNKKEELDKDMNHSYSNNLMKVNNKNNSLSQNNRPGTSKVANKIIISNSGSELNSNQAENQKNIIDSTGSNVAKLGSHALGLASPLCMNSYTTTDSNSSDGNEAFRNSLSKNYAKLEDNKADSTDKNYRNKSPLTIKRYIDLDSNDTHLSKIKKARNILDVITRSGVSPPNTNSGVKVPSSLGVGSSNNNKEGVNPPTQLKEKVNSIYNQIQNSDLSKNKQKPLISNNVNKIEIDLISPTANLISGLQSKKVYTNSVSNQMHAGLQNMVQSNPRDNKVRINKVNNNNVAATTTSNTSNVNVSMAGNSKKVTVNMMYSAVKSNN